MELSLKELGQVFMHQANLLSQQCFAMLEVIDDKPPTIKKRKRRRAARIASKVALKKLPEAVARLEKHGCVIDKDKATTWKVYINNKRKNYPKIGVIKPKTGKLELLERVDGRVSYRTCTLKEMLKAKKKGGVE